jgi:hypothetical protein
MLVISAGAPMPIDKLIKLLKSLPKEARCKGVQVEFRPPPFVAWAPLGKKEPKRSVEISEYVITIDVPPKVKAKG